MTSDSSGKTTDWFNDLQNAGIAFYFLNERRHELYAAVSIIMRVQRSSKRPQHVRRAQSAEKCQKQVLANPIAKPDLRP